ncbi:sulfite exporter TauE/SafE family protein, partial [Algoriphagus aestuarii]|nr:sulfite exporter TauE/SafE family protein [Algoriphagus aestuarii]
YSTLVWASSQGQAGLSAALMATFGLGTLPTLMATGLLANRLTTLLRRRAVRITAALLIILFGIWTIPGPHTAWLAGGHHASTGSHLAH